MKKFYLIAAMACMALAASAQQRVSLSTYQGTDINKFDGKEVAVTVSRYVITGWNTLSLPFALTTDELNTAFGSACRLERLVGVESNDAGIVLNFQDCKASGVQPNTPYILYYTGENGSKRIVKTTTLINGTSMVNFTDSRTGATVTMGGVPQKTDGKGLYGILARDNAEATFVSADDVTNGFYATRCFVQVSNGNKTPLLTHHIGEGEATSINSVARAGERVEVFNVSGVKVADRIDGLQPGVYVVKGRKVFVK
jgi:hypothetical protein